MVEKQHVFLHLDLTVNLVDTYLKRTLHSWFFVFFALYSSGLVDVLMSTIQMILIWLLRK